MNTVVFPYGLERKTNVKKTEISKLSDNKLLDTLVEYFKSEKDLEKIANECISKLEYAYSLNQNGDILKIKRKAMNHKLILNATDEIREQYGELIEFYNQSVTAMQQALDQYLKVYRETLDENRAILQKFIQNNDYVLKTLPLINKDFNCKLEKYLATNVAEHTAKIRKLDHQIVRLMSRATMKTSPFSFLTSVCLYELEDTEAKESLITSLCEINNYLLKVIYDKILEQFSFAKQAIYRLNAFSEYATCYVFLYQRDYEKGKVYKTVDGTITCKKNFLLQYLTANSSDKLFSFHELTEFLLSKGIDEEQAEKYVYENLILKNIITPALSVDETKPDIFAEFYRKLADFQDNEEGILQHIIANVRNYEEYLHLFQQADWGERFCLADKMDRQVSEIETLLGQSFVHNILVYEDSFYKTPEAPLTAKELERFDFSNLQMFFQLFDQSLLTYELFSENYFKKYGHEKRNAADLDVYQLFVQTSSSLDAVWKDNFSAVSDSATAKMQKITELKKSFLMFLHESKRTAGPVNIKQFVDALVCANRDLFRQEVDSATLFVQKAKEGNLVLNKVYKGQLVFFSRFLKIFAKDDCKLQQYYKHAFGTNPMEITESFGFNANVHERVFPNRLVLNLTDLNDSTETDINIRDCYFYYDEQKRRVKLGHDDFGEVNGVFLGSLAYNLMPIALRTINGMQPTTRFDTAFLNYWKSQSEDTLVADHMPRVMYDNIVIIREQYLINSIYDLTKPAEELYRCVAADFLDAGMPLRFFVRPYINSGEFDFYSMGRTSLKPQFIDLNSPLLFAEFLRELENNKQIIVEEVYPDNADEEYVYEYEIERTNYLV